MRSTALTRGIVALTAGATAATLLAAGAGAATAANPPYEPDGRAVGTIAFYDKTGNVITSGSTQVPFAGYAVGSAAPRSGDQQAGLAFANPNPNASTYDWYTHPAGSFTSFPTTSAPQSINSQTTPVYTSAAGDQTIDEFESSATHYSGTGYTNMVQIRLYTANAGGQVTKTYDDADLLIDPAAHTWTEVYPTNAGGGTTTTKDTSSFTVSAPAAVNYGSTATITGTLTDTTTHSGLAGQTATLYERASSSAPAHKLLSVKTTSGGAARTTVKLSGRALFAWYFPGNNTVRSASSAYKQVLVNAVVGISASHTSIKHGATAVLYGVTSPAATGTRIYLQQYVHGRWKTVGSVAEKRQTLPNHHKVVGYSFARKFASKGTFGFRTYKSATSTVRGAYSKSVQIHVR